MAKQRKMKPIAAVQSENNCFEIPTGQSVDAIRVVVRSKIVSTQGILLSITLSSANGRRSEQQIR